MSYQRKPIGSPCSLCGEPVGDEAIAVRTLTNTLPYTPKIWHRTCFEQRQARPVARSPQEAVCGSAARAG
jgi:hypothetical protein